MRMMLGRVRSPAVALEIEDATVERRCVLAVSRLSGRPQSFGTSQARYTIRFEATKILYER
jgi:hypothetical protein